MSSKSFDIHYDLPALINETAVLNSIHNIVIAINVEGKVIVFNKASEKYFECPAEKVLGRHVDEVLPPTGLIKVLKTGRPHIGRKFVLGDTLFVVNRTPVIKDGRIIGAIGVAQDITELRDIEEELEMVKELKGTLETILEAGNDGYAVENTRGEITIINKSFAELLDISPEEAVGKRLSELVNKNQVWPVSPTGKARFGEILRLKDRNAVVMRYPIKRDGDIIGAVSKVIFRDVTELNEFAERIKRLNRELNYYKNELDKAQGVRYTLDDIIAQSPSMLELKETVRRVAQGPSTILIRGESGTGKELFAHAVHAASYRRSGQFIKVNCAAVPENLLESELFGYQEGAFTGAKKGGQVGKFEQANGGTIFLDEIGDMSKAMQAKLLRVLQEKEIERLGDSRPRQVDVRVVTATNRDLEAMIERGEFREDLYYRLNVVTIKIPPLRERMEDLEPLVHHFLRKFNNDFGTNVSTLTPEVWDIFKSYTWPGNVRELENVIERAFNLVSGNTIKAKHLPLYIRKKNKGKAPVGHKPLPSLLEQVEREAVLDALEATGGNKMQAAKRLGISRAWLYKKIKQYGIKK